MAGAVAVSSRDCRPPYATPARTMKEGDMTAPPRVLITTYDVIGPTMAGPGIRAREFARVLGQLFPTTLAAPPPIPTETEGFAMAAVPLERLGRDALIPLIREHDIIIAQTLPFHFLPDDILAEKYFIADLYCPWLFENLEHYRLEDHRDRSWMGRDLEAMSSLFINGDFFVCAGDAQRAYWLGALSMFGRLTEAVYAQDRDGKTLIDVVPFGLQAEPPRKTAAVLKGVVPGIGPDDFVALWGGGVWNWLDPLTLIRATARLRDRGYPIRSFFLGTQRPSASEAATLRPTMVDTARQLSDELGLTGSHVFFNDGWVPYEERTNYLLEADVGISLHQPTLETRFAFRTRVLDYLWAGLVPVVNDGDTIADLVRSNDVGCVVPIGDDGALAEAIAALINEPAKRATLSARCRNLARSHTWEAAAQPIIDFCRAPWKGQRGDRVAAAGLYDEMKKMRATGEETSTYAKRLEHELANRDAHIAHLEQRIASPSLRALIATRVSSTPLQRIVNRVRRH
jgi:glycosyltransferase involved in cell wall biosynthesis